MDGWIIQVVGASLFLLFAIGVPLLVHLKTRSQRE